MGTNFYCHTLLEGMAQPRVLHVGKMSSGWPFIWRGYRLDRWGGGIDLETQAKWRDFLQSPRHRIVDEWGNFVATEHFFFMVEQTDWAAAKGWGRSSEIVFESFS